MDYSILFEWINQFMVPFFRVTAFFMVVSIFGTRLLPAKIRMGLALLTTIAIFHYAKIDFKFSFSVGTFVILAHEVLIGIALGFVVQIFFHIFVMSSQMIAMQMGLGFASMVDPTNGVSVPVLGQFYLVFTTLTYLILNGHLQTIAVLAESFTVYPVLSEYNTQSMAETIYSHGQWLFVAAFQIAMPGMLVLLIINIAFGIMTKAAPQLNIFSLGFPLSMIIGLVIIWFLLTILSTQIIEFINEMFEIMVEVISHG